SEKEQKKKKRKINDLNNGLIKIDDELMKKVLCEGCKEKKIKDLITKCGNEEMAILIYESKLNSYDKNNIRWILFNEFENIEYLAKGGFGVVHKANWISSYDEYDDGYKKREVVLKRLYNS